jgi:hypothetical protein
MERATVPAPAPQDPPFGDGLGERRLNLDPAGAEALELLCIRPELAAVPSFEFALRERVSRLAAFRPAGYARVRGVERIGDGATLAVVSERVEGVRLSDLLFRAELQQISLDINSALWLLRQLVPAAALLHEHADTSIAHGALGPERLIVTAAGRVVVVEYVLGAALEQLRFSQERYWSELRIPLPRAVGLPRLDRRADVTALGAVALSLILGRQLREDEYPARVEEVLASTWAVSARGGFEPLPAGLRGWIGRALQLDSRTAFASAVEARDELEKVLDTESVASPASLQAFLARCGLTSEAAQPQTATRTPPAVAPPVQRAAATTAPARTTLPAAPGTATPAASRVSAAEPRPMAVAPQTAAPPPSRVSAAAPRPTAVTPPTAAPSRAAAPPPASRPAGAPAGTAPRAATPAVAPPSSSPAGAAPLRPAVAASPVPRPVTVATPPSSANTARPPQPGAAPFTAVRAANPQPAAAPATAAAAPLRANPGGAPVSTLIPSAAPAAAGPVLPKVATAPVAPKTSPPAAPPVATAPDPLRPAAPPAMPEKTNEAAAPTFGMEPPQPELNLFAEEQKPAKRRWPVFVTAALVLAAIAAGGILFGRHFIAPPPAPVTTGSLVVTTSPGGVEAFIDGERRGTTPLTLTLPAGTHVLELRGVGEPRRIPLTIAAGAQISQYLELTPATAVPVTGQLQIRTDPPGAQVTVDEVPQGVSPLTVGDLAPGEHTVVLESPLGTVKQIVVIESGVTASLVVPMAAPANVPVSGWVAVSAPVDMQLFEQGRLIGSSQSERIMVSAGRHEIEIVNETLGYRTTRVVQVAPGKVAAVKVEMPMGTIALNAVPWAEVWIDGKLVGETPIGNLPVPVGPHEIVFRHPELGEQRHATTVTLTGPARLSVDLRKQ